MKKIAVSALLICILSLVQNISVAQDTQAVYELLSQGDKYLQAKQWNKAIIAYNEIIKSHPYQLNALKNRGLALKNQKRYREALEDFDYVLKIDDNDIEAYYQRAQINYKLNKQANALRDYRIVLQHSPTPEIYTAIGKIMHSMGDIQQAENNYNKAIYMNANFAPAYQGRAVVRRLQKNYQGALQDLESAESLMSTLYK